MTKGAALILLLSILIRSIKVVSFQPTVLTLICSAATTSSKTSSSELYNSYLDSLSATATAACPQHSTNSAGATTTTNTADDTHTAITSTSTSTSTSTTVPGTATW